MTYPPEPWDLRGAAVVSVWWRRGPVCTAFVDYQPDGVMAYHELLVARPTRHGVTIPSIWVDSPASRAGGRDLWAIPKDLADFDGPHTALGIARVRFRAPRWGVPVVLPGRTWQKSEAKRS
ncbi:hypothetical protein GCM10023148_57270 [Actinokineospora soli]